MSSTKLENLHTYDMFALGKVFGPTSEMEHSPLDTTLFEILKLYEVSVLSQQRLKYNFKSVFPILTMNSIYTTCSDHVLIKEK